jgi:YtkA-like
MALRIALLAAIGAALAVPTAATAGGWATVGFDPPPEDLAPGQGWQVELTILQHGRTPLEGVKPRVMVQEKAGDGQGTFPARPTGEPGVYRATVIFESAGTWKLAVDDGFSATHRFPGVEVGKGGKGAAESVALANTAAAAPPSAGDDGPNLLLAFAAAAVAALAAGLGATALQRRRGGPSAAGG